MYFINLLDTFIAHDDAIKFSVITFNPLKTNFFLIVILLTYNYWCQQNFRANK